LFGSFTSWARRAAEETFLRRGLAQDPGSLSVSFQTAGSAKIRVYQTPSMRGLSEVQGLLELLERKSDYDLALR
jgi:hypothetical protein